MRTKFTNYPHISAEQDAEKTGFYAWLRGELKHGMASSVPSFPAALEGFLGPLGYCNGRHFLGADQLSAYRDVYYLFITKA